MSQAGRVWGGLGRAEQQRCATQGQLCFPQVRGGFMAKSPCAAPSSPGLCLNGAEATCDELCLLSA